MPLAYDFQSLESSTHQISLSMFLLQISALDLAKGTECLDLALKHCGVKAKLVPAPDEVWKVSNFSLPISILHDSQRILIFPS